MSQQRIGPAQVAVFAAMAVGSENDDADRVREKTLAILGEALTLAFVEAHGLSRAQGEMFMLSLAKLITRFKLNQDIAIDPATARKVLNARAGE